MTDQTAAQFDQEAADYAAMDINPAAEIAAMMTSADADDPAPAEAPADRDYCGCCGNLACEAPAGLHNTCCRDLHGAVPVADPMAAAYRVADLMGGATTPAPSDWDRKVITDARQLANARTHADIRAALTTLSPIHAADLIPDADLHTYAFGVTQEIIRTLAHMAERNA